MKCKGIKFILENAENFNIVFTSAGNAFHVGGGDIEMFGSGVVLTITGITIAEARNYYLDIAHISDIVNVLGIDSLFDINGVFQL